MRARSGTIRALAVFGMVALVSSGCAFVQRVSVDSTGHQGNDDAKNSAISADGRYVAFESSSTLVAGDTNNATDVFVRDTAGGTTTRVSVGSGETQSNGRSLTPSISADGRYVAFTSEATNLVTGDTNNETDVFVRDTVRGTTSRVNVSSGGTQANGFSAGPSISADGRFVAFTSGASNLVAGDTNTWTDVFVRDTAARTTTRVSIGGLDVEANAPSYSSSISADGRHVAFNSAASNLVVGDTNGFDDTFVRDTAARTTTRVSVGTAGTQTDYVPAGRPAISADGHYVAFASYANTLVPGDTNGQIDVFVRDTVASITTRVSVTNTGTQAGWFSSGASISANGRYVAFTSLDETLVTGDTNELADAFVRDTVAGTTTRVSIGAVGAQANGDSFNASISADGRYVAFDTNATNLVGGDTNTKQDVVVRTNPQPAVTGITPSIVGLGETTAVSIAGSGFIPGAIVVVDGQGSTVSAVTVVSATEIVANVTIDAGAALGARNVWVELPGTGPGAGAGAAGLCAACVTVSD